MINKNKVIIIGLDGATFKLIKPWVKEGKLPTFAKLMNEGVYGELKSSPDMMSPSAWTCFSTGKNPGKHGIYNFLDTVPGTLKMRYLNSIHRDSETLWSLLSKAGKKAGVLNIPMTYPADDIDGFMISGWNAPGFKSDGFTHPPELIDEITEKFGGYYPLLPTVKKHIVENKPELGINELNQDIIQKKTVSEYLMKNKKWDLFITFFIHTDQVQHYYWHYMDTQHPQYDPDEAKKYGDAIFNIFKKCDQIIYDHICNLDDDTTVLVMSDHGHGPNNGAVQYLPIWLKKMALAQDKKALSANPIKIPYFWVKHKFSLLLKGMYNKLNKQLSIKAKSILNTLFPALRDKVESTWRFSAYDWSKTKVYFHYEPKINLKGREPYGIVSPGKEYENLRDYLIAKLYECRDVKTGQKVVEKVFKGEEVFHGKHIKNSPDIVIWWKEGIVISGLTCTSEEGAEIKVTEKYISDPRTGNHEPYGIFIAKGKNLESAKQIKGAEIIDIAPTVLHLMGMPVPEDMDGKVLSEIFKKDFLESNPVRNVRSNTDKIDRDGEYSESDEQKVIEHLKNLGYMN